MAPTTGQGITYPDGASLHPSQAWWNELAATTNAAINAARQAAIASAASDAAAGDAATLSAAQTHATNAVAAARQALEASISALTSTVSDLDTDLANLETLTGSGRLSKAQLDAAYAARTALTALEELTTTGRLSEASLMGTIDAARWFRGRYATPGAHNLNDFKTSGFYEFLTATVDNIPAPNIGTLQVFDLNNGVGTVQRYTTWEVVPRTFVRRFASGAWAPWALEPTRTEVTALGNRVTSLEETVGPDALSPWRSALANAGTAPAQVLVIGDSISEGTGATVLANRWQTILQGHLRRRYGHLQGATWPHIPARYNVTGTSGQPVTETGTNQFGYAWGLGWRTVRMEDDTGSLTFTFTGTSARVMFVQLGTTGVASVQVDGGTPVLVNTNGATNNARTWDTGPLTRGTHTITIRRDPSSAAGQHVYVQGALTWDGDEDKGIRVVDAAKHGISSSQFTTAAANQVSDAVKAAGTFGLAIIAVGTNDYSSAVTPAAYRENIERLIAALRAPTRAGFTGSIILLNVYRAGGRDEAQWQQYGNTLAELAATDPLITYVDLRTSMPDVPTPHSDPSGLSLYADALHPSDQGHKWIAGALFDVLTS